MAKKQKQREKDHLESMKQNFYPIKTEEPTALSPSNDYEGEP